MHDAGNRDGVDGTRRADEEIVKGTAWPWCSEPEEIEPHQQTNDAAVRIKAPQEGLKLTAAAERFDQLALRVKRQGPHFSLGPDLRCRSGVIAQPQPDLPILVVSRQVCVNRRLRGWKCVSTQKMCGDAEDREPWDSEQGSSPEPGATCPAMILRGERQGTHPGTRDDRRCVVPMIRRRAEQGVSGAVHHHVYTENAHQHRRMRASPIVTEKPERNERYEVERQQCFPWVAREVERDAVCECQGVPWVADLEEERVRQQRAEMDPCVHVPRQ